MRVNQEFIMREIANEHILIPVGATALKIQGMITLSESGQMLFRKLQEECSEEELVEALLAEYAVEKEKAAADVKAFLAQMQEVGILSKEESK